MDIKSQKCVGTLKISEDVIGDITANVIRETKGVTEYKLPNKIGICNKPSVSVKFINGAVEITVFISLAFGSKAQVCAESLQNKIKNYVQDMTGIMVSKVNVKIISLI